MSSPGSCYVCVNTSCRASGSPTIFDALRERLADAGIAVHEQICFGACWMGPNVVVEKDAVWYCGVELADVDEIVASIKDGTRVERLIDSSDPGLSQQVALILKSAMG